MLLLAVELILFYSSDDKPMNNHINLEDNWNFEMQKEEDIEIISRKLIKNARA